MEFFLLIARGLKIFILLLPSFSMAQSDSVISGRHKGNSKVQINKSPASGGSLAPPASTYLLKGVRLTSTGGRCVRKTVLFGPFNNQSDTYFTIILNHIGGSSHHSSTSAVDGVIISRAEGGSQSFVVPPGSTYQWWAENDHTISAITSSTIADTQIFGLPNAQNFSSPARIGTYKGCRHLYNDSDDVDHYTPIETQYYFTPSAMTDGSDCWNEFFETSEFGSVILGPAPQNPGICLDTRTRPPPPFTGD